VSSLASFMCCITLRPSRLYRSSGTDHLRWMGDARFTYGVVKKCAFLLVASPSWLPSPLHPLLLHSLVSLSPFLFLSIHTLALELATWQGTVYLKLDPSTSPTSKAVLARHARSAPRHPTPSSDAEAVGHLVDSSNLSPEAAPWLAEETKHEWVSFQSGGEADKKSKGGGGDVVYVYAGLVSMVSRWVAAFTPRKDALAPR
jgi:hypothetical protein